MADVTMSLEEYESLRAMALNGSCANCSMNHGDQGDASPKPKRKPSAYNKRFSKAFKKVQGKYKKKNGGWLKDGFKRAQREAHKIAGRNR